MIWIGILIGISISAALVLIAAFMYGAQAVKERKTVTKTMSQYWEDNIMIQRKNAATFRRIEDALFAQRRRINDL